MRSVLLAFGLAGALVASLFGCSLLVSTDDLTAGGASAADGAPSTDGASNDAAIDAVASDSSSTDGGAGEAGDGALPRFCARAPHAFCEDFDDPGFVLPGRWEIGTNGGGKVTLDTVSFSSGPRACNFDVPKTSLDSAATLFLDTKINVARGVLSFDAQIPVPPSDNYNLFDLEFPSTGAGTATTYDLDLLVTPNDLRYFEQSNSLFNEWLFHTGMPAGWHHYEVTFDLVKHTSSVAFDGVNSSGVNAINSGFAPGNLSLGVGIGYARPNAGHTSILVDNVTLDVP
jgi:hypothetical protein